MKFNVVKEVENITNFIKEYYQKNNLKGAVLGISGGKDSAVVAALLVRALGSENVVGITLPCHSKNTDAIDAKLISEKYNFELINIDLTNTYDTFKHEINKLGEFNNENLKNSDINIKPRLRMSACYYIAALYGAIKGGVYLVAGTSNKCELYVGYFTKGGDSTYDIGILNDYTVDEVIKIGEYLEVPEKVLYKKPSDGLSGQTDEDKLGVKYKDIADVINNKEVSEDIKHKVDKLHTNNLHKFNIPVYNRETKWKKNKIAVYVGSFNPVHKAHIKVAKHILKNYTDKVIIVPTGNYWNKNNLINIEDRIKMLKLYETKNIIIDTKINHCKYTYEVLRNIKKEYPNSKIYLIIGDDNLKNFDKWKNINDILKYDIIVIKRNNIKTNMKNGNFIYTKRVVKKDISSTIVRKMIVNKNIMVLKYIDFKVYKYIRKNNLYVDNNMI